MAAPPAALFPPMQMPPLPIRSPSPPPHFPIPGPHDSLRRLPKPLPDFDFDWALPTRWSPPGPRLLPRPFSWTADEDETIKFHARHNSSAASTPTVPSPSHSRWPSSAGFSSTSSTTTSPTEHDRPAVPSYWVTGADSSPPPRRKTCYNSVHQPRSPETMGPTSPYPEPPLAAQTSFRAPPVVNDVPRGTGGAKERAARKRAEKDGISDIILEIDAALDRIGGPRAAALKCPSPLPSPGTPVRSEFGSRFKVRQESPLRHGRSVTMPEGLGGGQGDEGNSGGGGGVRPTTPTTQFMSREPHSPTTSSPLKGNQRRNPPTLGPPPVSSRARYRPVSDVVAAHASTVAAPKTTFPAPSASLVAKGSKPTANSSMIRTAVAPDPSTALHSNPPCLKRSTMPPGALLSAGGGTMRSISSGTTLVSNGSSGHGNGRSVSSPLGNISIAAAASSSTPALYCPPDAPPVPPVHRTDPSTLAVARQGDHGLNDRLDRSRSRPRALSASSSSPSPSPSPYAYAASGSASTSASPSSLTSAAAYSFSPSASGSPSSHSSPSSRSSSSSSSQRNGRGRRLRRKFSPRRASLRELRDRHSDACLKQAFEWGVKRYLEGTIFWDGKEADLFLGPEGDDDGDKNERAVEGGEVEYVDARDVDVDVDGVWADCREWAESGEWSEWRRFDHDEPVAAKGMGMGLEVGVALGGEDFFERGRARRSLGVSSINVEVGHGERGWAEEVLGAAMG
ncbi:hypothetical protein IWZ00DRAFT_491476 [Phyllosticta capitalensis]